MPSAADKIYNNPSSRPAPKTGADMTPMERDQAAIDHLAAVGRAALKKKKEDRSPEEQNAIDFLGMEKK